MREKKEGGGGVGVEPSWHSSCCSLPVARFLASELAYALQSSW